MDQKPGHRGYSRTFKNMDCKAMFLAKYSTAHECISLLPVKLFACSTSMTDILYLKEITLGQLFPISH